ncbi:isochorismate synthase DhbC [Paenibacillus sp. N1-5-1-14]|uniref:isochorismate synthase DhbC n=1 Tax=Paenibacillus radicibacter TaxID=2972488 RepID=UPI002159662A|nr:isochorismate synthase DhbC [Paenibacillus radicibacter]MCR8642846.1 isochorismate synthase DhbC [Paenibacillus radicibacter]
MVNQVTIPAASASELLDQYREGTSFFLASPERTLLTEGEVARLTVQEQVEGAPSLDVMTLPRRIADLLAHQPAIQGHKAIVVGAIPFHTDQPVELIVPRTIQWSNKLSFQSGQNDVQPLQSTGYTLRPVPEPAAYENSVSKAVIRFGQGELHKVVLARTLHLTMPTKIDVHKLLRNLAKRNPHGYTFAVNLASKEARNYWASTSESGSGCENETPELLQATGTQEPRTLIGASPELLVTRTGNQIRVNPLAGSAARSLDPLEDHRRSEALLVSPKDRHEHAVVIEAVAAVLRPYCRNLDVPAQPSLLQTNAMWHLSTVIQGELDDPTVSSLELALALHPTPAVCGTPTDLARETIQESEPFNRGFYAGMVGWCNADGEGEWVLTIRCAEVEGRELRMYAGAGIVAGSTPQAELAETSAKFQTMLHAIGLNQPKLAEARGSE